MTGYECDEKTSIYRERERESVCVCVWLGGWVGGFAALPGKVCQANDFGLFAPPINKKDISGGDYRNQIRLQH